MRLKFLQIFKIFCLICFASIVLTFIGCDVFFIHKKEMISSVPIHEYILKIVTSLILGILPIFFLIYIKQINKNKYFWYFIFLFFCLYYLFLFLLLSYFIVTENFFDLDFFVDNIHEAFFTISHFFDGFSIIFILVFCLIFISTFFISVNIFKLQSYFAKKIIKIIIIISSIILIVSVFIQFYLGYEKGLFLNFINTFFIHNDRVYQQYNNDYDSLVDRYFSFDINNFQIDNEKDLPDIYFIHLESVSGYLKDKSIIPNFDNYSKQYGINFDNFYSNSMQTLLAQESILCALPPSMNGYFKYKFNPENLICIPEILSNAGYKTLFFKSHNLEFSGTGKFMSQIGFSEVHNNDIIKPKDIQYK